MNLGAVVFYALAVATIAASLGVVTARSVVYSALLLILALALTGLIYLVLLADFLALIQILIYGGTVSILLLFALMLTRPRETAILSHPGWPFAALGASVLGAVLIAGVVLTSWARLPGGASPPAARLAPDILATTLFTVWLVPLEIVAVILLVALVGSLVIARATETAPEPEEAA